MGNTVGTRLGPSPDKPEEIHEADLVLCRKLQILVDSCVGVLHRNDFLDFNCDLDEDDLRDLSRFLYLSFPTDRKAENQNDELKPYLFRSAILSIFGHIIVNSMAYIKKNASQNDPKKPSQFPFLHIVTGTPGLGKSASRYPFITLLMSFGVKAVTTMKAGECAFVFEFAEQSKADYATVTIVDSDGQARLLEVLTYFYHYNVRSYLNEGTKPTSESTSGTQTKPETNPQPETKSKSEDDYCPAKIKGASSYLGQIIVPSVECFPHFLRLIIGKKDHISVSDSPIPHDVTVNAQSLLKKGSVIAGGSILYSVVPPETLKAPLILEKLRSVAKHSVINPGSVLLSRPFNAVMTLPPDQLPPIQTIHVETYSYLVKDNIILHPDSVIAAGSFLLHHGPNHKEVFSETKPLDKDYTIEAGSTIKAGSSIIPKSKLFYGYSVQNKFRGTKWHIIDEFVFFFVMVFSLRISHDTNIPKGNHCVLFTSPEGSRWNDTDAPGGKGRQYFIAEYVVPKYSLQEEAALLNTMGQDEELSKARQKSIEEGLRKFSFIPRFILEEGRAGKMLAELKRGIPEDKLEIPPDDFFGRGVSHKLVHFSCPQYDCHNWFVQFATVEARRYLLDMFNLHSTRNYNKFLTSLATNPDNSQKRGAIFHNFVLDAIAGGLYIENPTRIHSKTPPPCLPFWLPESLGESNIYLRSSTNVLRACLPDISRIKTAKLSPYEAKYDVLFKIRWAHAGHHSSNLTNMAISSPYSGLPPPTNPWNINASLTLLCHWVRIMQDSTRFFCSSRSTSRSPSSTVSTSRKRR
ncbi:hypothetical protein BLNAU_13640 [Blattamonas nauphoetae]|uniref:Uncharacterized protein n=1 Tax=Blattamonas nauphoetae TaxID=2049346 RepID=A0ABQ9XJH7_9EUKA|nr:hypothetical protein BLNAU_13640 [Blattamonas nauphoetae]